jgi:hypothetical protein
MNLLVFVINDTRKLFMVLVVGEICVVHCGIGDFLFGRQ